MGLTETIKPMRDLKEMAFIRLNLTFTRTCTVQGSGGICRNLACDLKLYWGRLFIFGVKLIVMSYVRLVVWF
jgi:hypothetical protein